MTSLPLYTSLGGLTFVSFFLFFFLFVCTCAPTMCSFRDPLLRMWNRRMNENSRRRDIDECEPEEMVPYCLTRQLDPETVERVPFWQLCHHRPRGNVSSSYFLCRWRNERATSIVDKELTCAAMVRLIRRGRRCGRICRSMQGSGCIFCLLACLTAEVRKPPPFPSFSSVSSLHPFHVHVSLSVRDPLLPLNHKLLYYSTPL